MDVKPGMARFLHQWRFPLVVTGLCLMALAVTSPVPLAPALAPASSAGALSLAASMVSWAMAVVQVAGGSASVAVPALTFFYAWKCLAKQATARSRKEPALRGGGHWPAHSEQQSPFMASR